MPNGSEGSEDVISRTHFETNGLVAAVVGPTHAHRWCPETVTGDEPKAPVDCRTIGAIWKEDERMDTLLTMMVSFVAAAVFIALCYSLASYARDADRSDEPKAHDRIR